MDLHSELKKLFDNDADFIAKRDAHYESSWKRRSGIGAMMTIARPWDRFEAIAKRNGWDIFQIIKDEIAAGKTEADDGTLQACIRDLRAYMALLAVEANQLRAATTPTPCNLAGTSSPREQAPREKSPPRHKLLLSKLIDERRSRDDRVTNVGEERDNLDTLIQILFETL